MSPREVKVNECRDCTALPRRDVIRAGAAGAVTVLLGSLFPGCKNGEATVQLVRHARTSIGTLTGLKQNEPLLFCYPDEDLDQTDAMLIKLGREAGGGVGPDRDVVAFSAYCTHMGGSLADGYLAAHRLLGCSEHLTTFDLTRHGQVVAGHATQALPQIVLEVEGDAIFATGIVGLLYGYDRNPRAEA